MKRLGADSVPVVARGESFTYAQVLTEVADFLGIEPPDGGVLEAAALVEKLDMILDAGPLKGGIGSTVVDVTSKTPIILREGEVVTRDILKAAET